MKSRLIYTAVLNVVLAVGLSITVMAFPTHTLALAASTADLRLSYTVPASERGTNVATDSSAYHNNGVLKGGVNRRYGHYKFHRLTKTMKYDRIVAKNSASMSTAFDPFSYSVRLRVKPDVVWKSHQMAVIRHGDAQHGTGGNYKMELNRGRTTGAVSASCVMHSQGAGVAYIRGKGALATIEDRHWHTITCARLADGDIALTIDDHTRTRTPKVALTDMTGQAKLLIGCQRQSGHFIEQFVGKMDNITITAGS